MHICIVHHQYHYVYTDFNTEYFILTNTKPPIGWDRPNAAPLKFDTKPSSAAFSVVFSSFNKCQPEVAVDVVSGVAVD